MGYISFRKKVLEVVNGIPRGRTLSYKDVAGMAGRSWAWRAVGNILNKNYDPKIPCHRVIRSDGKIGGYNRGVVKKRNLLRSESCKNIPTFCRMLECFCVDGKSGKGVGRRGKRIKLKRGFYVRDTLIVAKDLLGKYIVRRVGKKKISGKIIETEAYIGPQDRASHAYKNKRTPRNEAEYLAGGHIYIYLVYGMYWQLNISTSKEGRPECVLIRALEVSPLAAPGAAGGPGKLCRYLKLDKSFYGEDLTTSNRIWLEDCGEKLSFSQIRATARIGIEYAGPYWSRRKWRFFIKDTGVKIRE